MHTEEFRQHWLGIDFSGDHLKWQPHRKSNIYVAQVCLLKGKPVLRTLQTVQELPGQEVPFQRLVRLLRARNFIAAAIDAPFSIPREYLPYGGHRMLLGQVAGIERQNRPFPAAQDFICCVLAGRNMSSRKPLRECELAWKQRKINVRSTLWDRPRGGAAMTAACLVLLYESQCPVWPWHKASEPGLLVEAFPAAQLCHWGMEFQRYNGDSPESLLKRAKLVDSLSELIGIPNVSLKKKMEQSADALDAVLCAFAAMSVSNNRVLRPSMSSDEGDIAVHERIEGQRFLIQREE